MYVNAIQGTFFQLKFFCVSYVMRKFLSRKGGGFSASSLVLNSTISTCELDCKCRRSCVAVALSRCTFAEFHVFQRFFESLVGHYQKLIVTVCKLLSTKSNIFHVCFTTNLCLFVCFLFCEILRQIALGLRRNGLFPLAFDCYHLKLDDETNKTRNVPHSCMLGIFPNKVVKTRGSGNARPNETLT